MAESTGQNQQTRSCKDLSGTNADLYHPDVVVCIPNVRFGSTGVIAFAIAHAVVTFPHLMSYYDRNDDYIYKVTQGRDESCPGATDLTL